MRAPARGKILIVGRHPDMMARAQALLEDAGYEHVGALTDAEATAVMRSGAPDALLVGGGVEPASRAALITTFGELHPKGVVIEHFGGPALLLEHVRDALGQVT